MQFNKLRLTGFKSFVDPSELTILKGLTGVVGPNGCGKSNLLEALRWVMGENRASAMRGDGMEDVIFAGTTSRSARNFAEVVLSIDNSDRLAPAGFNEHDTLEVSRRITRDAGSAYKANGKDVRAKDIQMLFADASTGAHSPALVRQGQIAELINAKPKNRRRILEEAAGISGLYQRRHEAELKLKAADANLLRVDDVIDQLAAQLATLARQAKQAQRYREIGEDLRAEEIKLLYRRWLTADLARVAAEQEATTARTLTAAADRALREAAAKREKDEAALPPLREEDGIAAAILQRLVIEKETLTKDQDSAQSRIRGLRNALAQLEKDTLREAGLNQDAQSSVTALREERDDLKQQS
ncbi:MAG: AAA family ATPase, partial [Paracoccaceae bacterium]